MTYRIQRLSERDGVVFVLSGELDAEHVSRLRGLMAAERSDRVRLDLRDVTIVDRAGLEFLLHVDAAGVVLVNCAHYIRRLIAAEEQSR